MSVSSKQRSVSLRLKGRRKRIRRILIGMEIHMLRKVFSVAGKKLLQVVFHKILLLDFQSTD